MIAYEKNNRMISIMELIEVCFKEDKVTIPLLQRNYKWTQEDASKLAEDLWESFKQNKKEYTIGMISFFNDIDKNQIQLIDGQQRIITLSLFMKYLDSQKQYFTFYFERDNDVTETMKREYYIKNLLEDKNIDKACIYTDTIRFQENYDAMKVPLTKIDLYNIGNRIIEFMNEVQIDYKIYDTCISISDNKKIDDIKNCISESKNNFSNLNNIHNVDGLLNAFVLEELVQILSDNCIQVNLNCEDLKKSIKDSFLKYSYNERGLFNAILLSRDNDKIAEGTLKRIRNCINTISTYDKNMANGKFIDYILNNVYVLLHITDTEPLDEFLNINKNKTRFVISDYIKANLIIDTKNDEIQRNIILGIYGDLSKLLYGDEEVWKLISRGYECNQKNCDKFNNKKCNKLQCSKIHKSVNRLKILFSDRYEGNNIRAYVYDEELKRLTYYRNILNCLRRELKGTTNCLKNFNAYNSFCCLYKLKRIKFFEMFGKEYNEKIHKKQLEEIIWQHFNLEEIIYHTIKKNPVDLNYFFDSQLCYDIDDKRSSLELPQREVVSNSWMHIAGENNDLNEIMRDYIEYRKKENYERG